MSADTEKELEIKDLRISFRTSKGIVHAVRGINLSLAKGETLAIVGESGSGKSVTAKSLLGIEAANAVIEGGQVLYGGRNLLECSEREFERIRGNKITMIFQDPMSSLDPIMKIGPQLTEATILNGRTKQRLAAKEYASLLRQLKGKMPQAEIARFQRLLKEKNDAAKAERARLREQAAKTNADASVLLEKAEKAYCEKNFRVTRKMAYDKAIAIMEEVGIREPEKRFTQYPFEFSGGMRQRIVIAIAIAANPDLLICDEPTTALDVTIQAQILELINRLKESRGMSVIFITHDLGVVANVADRIAVMYAGKIVETGTADDIFYRPAHPYTWALLASMPDLDTKDTLEAIPGTPPNMLNPPKGDAFAPRNKYAMAIDFEEEPPLFKISESHYAATWLLHPKAPRVDMPKTVAERIARMQEREARHGS